MSMRVKQKQLPRLAVESKQCCGCGACRAVCPVGAIELVYGRRGFLEPPVDESICICGYRCMQACISDESSKDC